MGFLSLLWSLLTVAELVGVAELYEAAQTGNDTADQVLAQSAVAAFAYCHPVTPDLWQRAKFFARSLVLIAFAEQSYSGAVGDATIDAGPSIGAWQISRQGAEAQGLWSPPFGYAEGSPQDRAVYAAQPVTGPFSFVQAFQAARYFAATVEPKVTRGDFTAAVQAWNPGDPSYGQNALSIVPSSWTTAANTSS